MVVRQSREDWEAALTQRREVAKGKRGKGRGGPQEFGPRVDARLGLMQARRPAHPEGGLACGGSLRMTNYEFQIRMRLSRED